MTPIPAPISNASASGERVCVCPVIEIRCRKGDVAREDARAIATLLCAQVTLMTEEGTSTVFGKHKLDCPCCPSEESASQYYVPAGHHIVEDGDGERLVKNSPAPPPPAPPVRCFASGQFTWCVLPNGSAHSFSDIHNGTEDYPLSSIESNPEITIPEARARLRPEQRPEFDRLCGVAQGLQSSTQNTGRPAEQAGAEDRDGQPREWRVEDEHEAYRYCTVADAIAAIRQFAQGPTPGQTLHYTGGGPRQTIPATREAPREAEGDGPKEPDELIYAAEAILEQTDQPNIGDNIGRWYKISPPAEKLARWYLDTGRKAGREEERLREAFDRAVARAARAEQWVIDARATIAGLERERDEARTRLLSAAGDDLCRLTQEEIKQYTSGEVQIPPKEEFMPSCERFWEQTANKSGVLKNCLTLAQLVAENEKLRAELAKHQESEFHPDWSMLKATRDSLNECAGMVRAAKQRASTAEAALAELRGRLPHTADGVPVICDGMKVFCPRGHEHALSHPCYRLYCCKGDCWSDGCQGDSGSGTYYPFAAVRAVPVPQAAGGAE